MAKAKTKVKAVKIKKIEVESVEVKPVEKEWIEAEPERKCKSCGVTAPPRYDNRENARCTACWERFPPED